MKKILLNYKKYFISPLIVLLLLIVVFILNNVYPFGENTISNGDMGKAYTPIYYYMWDVFHGRANIFINFNVGMGTNMYDLTSVYGILSPFSWLIAFSERSNIPNFLSYLLILKLCFMSFTSFILFDNFYKKLDLFWKYLFSVIYALSGWTIVYHTNFVWLDNVILFPLIILGMKKIIVDDDYRLYTIILFFSLSLSYYISYMEILFILFSSFGYLKLFCSKKEKKRIIFKLGLGTVLSFGMSCVFFIPVLLQSFYSIRFSQDFLIQLFTTTFFDKLMIIIFYGLPIILYIYIFIEKKISSKVKKYFLFLFFVVCSGVIFDPINAMWHTGSYFCFPFRCGFIFVMIIYLGALYYLNFNSKLEFKEYKNYYISICFFLLVLIISFWIYVPINVKNNPSLYLDVSVIALVFFILLLSMVIIFYIIKIKDIKLKKLLFLVFFFISTIGFSLGYIGISSSKLSKEDTDITLFQANYLNKFLKNDNNGFNRYKNLNNQFVNNYPFVSGKSSISSWHMVDNSSFNFLNKMGYFSNFTELNEKDGTLFSDNLLGITKYISNKKINNDLYNLVDYNDKYYLYELDNYLGYGFIYDSSINFDVKENAIDFQNSIYHSLIQNNNNNILDEISYSIVQEDGYEITNNICSNTYKNELKFDINIKNKSNLYLYYDFITFNNKKDNLYLINYIDVNGERVYNSLVFDEFFEKFTNENGFINLGLYENEVVKVTIDLNKNFCIDNFKFIGLDINKLNKLINDYGNDIKIKPKKNKLLINAYSDFDNKSLFLPLNYLNGYDCKVNGKQNSIEKVLNNFISIDLEKGENKIILTYYPPYFKISFVISLIFLFVFVFLFKVKFKNVNKIVLNIFSILYYIVFVIVFIYVYIYGFFRL